MIHLKNLGYRDSTLLAMDRKLRIVAKRVNLDDPEAVKQYLANLGSTDAHKESVTNAYGHYVKFHGLKWTKPYYRREHRVSKIPREEDINKIISHASPKYALAYSIMRDTGLRPIELTWLRLKHIDLVTGRIYPTSAKHGSGRVLQLRPSTWAMLKKYVQEHNVCDTTRIWSTSKRLGCNWMRLRKSVAEKLGEPRLKHIRLYDLRHFYATLEYTRTKDILHVQRQLGHKSLQSTLRYIGLVNLDREEYLVKVAVDVKESSGLLEQGFDFVAVIEDKYVFRKPKLPSFFCTRE